MVNISSNLKKLLYSNTLPKAGIKISIKKTKKNYLESGVEYTEEEVMWITEKDITNVNLSQSIDITGAEFPSVKLSWEQNYVGDVDETLRPIDYYGVSEKMAVDFSIIYDYITYVFWKSFYEKRETWKNIYSSSKTWRDVFYSKEKEEVKQKRTFLSAFPQVQNEKIKWESRDLLYFLNGNISENTDFLQENPSNPISPVITRIGLISRILYDEKIRLYNTNDCSIELALSNQIVESIQNEKDVLTENQVFVGVAKEVLKNALSPINYFIDFSKENGALYFKNAETAINKKDLVVDRSFYLKNQTSFPKITIGTDISNYIFETSTAFVDYDDSYYVNPSSVVYYAGDGTTTQIFLTQGASTRYDKNGDVYDDLQTDYMAYETLDRIDYIIKDQYTTPVNLRLFRIKNKSTTTSHKINETGTEFEEKNSLNPFLVEGNRNFAIDRATILSSYYNAKNSKIVIDCFGDPSLECGDMVFVETNLKNKDTGKNITKKGLVKSMELSYNGAVKETITVHELN